MSAGRIAPASSIHVSDHSSLPQRLNQSFSPSAAEVALDLMPSVPGSIRLIPLSKRFWHRVAAAVAVAAPLEAPAWPLFFFPELSQPERTRDPQTRIKDR